jgi:hypothetical protein
LPQPRIGPVSHPFAGLAEGWEHVLTAPAVAALRFLLAERHRRLRAWASATAESVCCNPSMGSTSECGSIEPKIVAMKAMLIAAVAATLAVGTVAYAQDLTKDTQESC